MIVPIVIGLLVLVVVGLVARRMLGALRVTSLVSPILLDDALDADLRCLCRHLRQREDLNTAERCRIGHLIVTVAERRTAGERTEDDRIRVRRAIRALRRGATSLEAEKPNSA